MQSLAWCLLLDYCIWKAWGGSALTALAKRADGESSAGQVEGKMRGWREKRNNDWKQTYRYSERQTNLNRESCEEKNKEKGKEVIRNIREIVLVVKRGRVSKKGRKDMDIVAAGTFTVCSLVRYICSPSCSFPVSDIIRPLCHVLSCCSAWMPRRTTHTHFSIMIETFHWLLFHLYWGNYVFSILNHPLNLFVILHFITT